MEIEPNASRDGDSLPVSARDEFKERALSRFDALLTRVLNEEEDLSGIPEELWKSAGETLDQSDAIFSGCGLAEVWGGLTALTQEVKLQARSFQKLSETLSATESMHDALVETRDLHQSALQEILEAVSPLPREALERAEAQGAGRGTEIILDLRERLLTNQKATTAQMEMITSATRTLRGRLAGPVLKEAIVGLTSLHDGNRLTLERLQDYLTDMGIKEMEVEGEIFDPTRMNAIELVDAPSVTKGTVVRVHRPGYEESGKVFRVAEVGVAR